MKHQRLAAALLCAFALSAASLLQPCPARAQVSPLKIGDAGIAHNYGGVSPIDWQADWWYQQGSVVSYGGNICFGLQAQNLNHNPTSSPDYWRCSGGSAAAAGTQNTVQIAGASGARGASLPAQEFARNAKPEMFSFLQAFRNCKLQPVYIYGLSDSFGNVWSYDGSSAGPSIYSKRSFDRLHRRCFPVGVHGWVPGGFPSTNSFNRAHQILTACITRASRET